MMHDDTRQPLTVFTPRARLRRAVPWPALAALAAIFAFAVLAAHHLPWTAQAALACGVVLAGGALGAWLEERVYLAMVGHPGYLRLLVATLLPVGGLLILPPLVDAVDRDAMQLGAGIITPALVVGVVGWLVSAGVGSVIVLVLDLIFSAVLPDLRSRITVAALGLIVAAGGLALGLYRLVLAWAERLADTPFAWLPKLVGQPTLSRAEITELFSAPELHASLTAVFAALAALAGLPAVLSACGKLAEGVMDRVYPLCRAFDAVGQGRLAVRVEEAGSREFVALSQTFNRMVGSLVEARRVQHAFSVYVGEHVLSRIRAQQGHLTVHPALRLATALFVDIRGFTGLAERLAPAQVLSVLNRYFENVVPIVESHDGYLDKFVGDAMVVVFNAPIDQADHAERAVRCAIAIQQHIDRLNRANAFPEAGELKVGVGIATGQLVAGNLGSARRLDYTVVGDTVNTASRLTSLAEPGEILTNEATALALPLDLPRVALDPIKIKGKEQAVAVYRIWPQPVFASRPVNASQPPRTD